jgi:hypothetical protein
MPLARTDRVVSLSLSWALVAAPAMLLLVALLHLRHGARVWFVTSYVARPASEYVPALIAAGNRGPLLHDPHMVGYLSLPLLAFAAMGLYVLGRSARPLASAASLAVTLVGMVYLGGLFGTWTAFFRGFGDVDARYTEGATAAWAALTAPRGALLVTTTLAKLAAVGPALQALCLAGKRVVPAWAPLVAALGYGVIAVFWDLDDWMLAGEALVLAAMVPMRARLAAMGDVEQPAPEGAHPLPTRS